MNISDLKNVVGEVEPDKPVKIKFFGHVTESMASQFNSEFDFIENVIRPPRIDILINSEGGSVLHGMSTFATIQNSTVPTRCINEGLAASMGSVILVAGTETFLKDYSITMIHNPFLPDHKEEEPPSVVKAFTKQLETIYQRRFGLTKERVQSIMDGGAGEDGTYFDAEQAVQAGFVPESNVIRTSKQVVAEVKAKLQDSPSVQAIQSLFEQVNAQELDDFKQSDEAIAIHNQETPSQEELTQNKITVNMAEQTPSPSTIGFTEAAIAVQLGMKAYDITAVSAKIADLVGIEASYKELVKTHTELKTLSDGKDQAIDTLKQNLSDTQAKLDVYLNKEKDEQKASVVALVKAAKDAGKIKDEDVAKWEVQATANFELVKDLFENLPARDKISTEIAKDPNNVQAAKDAAEKTEKELAEAVSAVVGAEFKFGKLD